MSATPTPTYAPYFYLGGNPQVSRLLDNVQADTPGAALPVVQMECWNAIEDFYLKSTCERRVQGWQMAPGVSSINFNPYSADWVVAWVLGMADVIGLYDWVVQPPATVQDLQYPYNMRSGVVLLALKPANFNIAFGDMLFAQWFDTIKSGALANLYLKPAKPWSSPQLAEFHGRRFRAGIARARAIAQKEYTDGGGRWHFSRSQGFATGRRKQ